MLCESLLGLNGLPTRGRFSYSNYAYGTLGYVLSLAASKETGILTTFEDLMQSKVLQPLGMNNTAITYNDEDWGKAARGCSRGIKRSVPTIRLGKYGVLQGNGALRSTLVDMEKFLHVELLVGASNDLLVKQYPSPSFAQQKLFTAMKSLQSATQEACTCVSDWCEGNLCQLPNAVREMVTDGGITEYTSGLVHGLRKSGDTGGYSLRGAWSFEKRRGAFAVDTCGGCGSRGTAGSAAQRLALILADGPPNPDHGANTDIGLSTIPRGGQLEKKLHFVGTFNSHVYPSLADLQVTIEFLPDGRNAIVSAASSDGQGCASPAVQHEGAVWNLMGSILNGCGWQGEDDPLALVDQKRSIRLLGNDNDAAVLQEMGADIYLQAVSRDDVHEHQSSDKLSSNVDGVDHNSGGTSHSRLKILLSSLVAVLVGSIMTTF